MFFHISLCFVLECVNAVTLFSLFMVQTTSFCGFALLTAFLDNVVNLRDSAPLLFSKECSFYGYPIVNLNAPLWGIKIDLISGFQRGCTPLWQGYGDSVPA